MTEFYIGDKENPLVYVKFQEWVCIGWVIVYCTVTYISAFIKEWIREYRAVRRFKKDKEQIWNNIQDKLNGQFKATHPSSLNGKNRLN